MKRQPKLTIREYTILKNGARPAHPTHPFVIDLRSLGNGREFLSGFTDSIRLAAKRGA